MTNISIKSLMSRLPLADLALATGAVLAALVVGALLIEAAGLNAVDGYVALWKGAFGSVRSTAETLVRFCPLALSALSVLVGFRAGFFTIGVEGQLYMGALASTVVALFLPGLPPVILVPLALAAGVLAGTAWALLAGVLKIRFGVNEVISTIMLNYIAVLFVDFMVRGPIKEAGSNLQNTALITQSAWLPVMLERSRLHIGVLFPILVAVLVSVFLWRTSAGYRLRVVGANPGAARHAGINVNKSILLAVAISGAIAGLAGAVEIQGVFHRLQAGIASSHGYTAIAITLVGKMLPSATILASVLFAALSVGATMMQMKAAVPLPVTNLIQGLVILFVVGSDVFKRPLQHILRRREPVSTAVTTPATGNALQGGQSR